MEYKIDYIDASSRQEIVSIYFLYFYIVDSCSYNFDVGHLVISLLTYMVEEGRLNAYAMKVYEIKIFVNEYLKGIEYEDEYNLDEIVENLISKLQGAKTSGEPITYKYFDSELSTIKSMKIAYIDYDLKNEGFKITDKGLEFLISSKEIPQEAKLTVSLYLFKLQLEKKKYKAALNTIKNINLETLRQLDIKNEILSMNRYGHAEASKLYKKYWGDYFDIRSEETSHYEDAKERLQLYKETEYLEKNRINLTPEDLKVLKAIDFELAKSSNLQAVYTNEISRMPSEILEIDKSVMENVFLSLFDIREHFDNLTKPDTPISAFLNSVHPLFLPRRNKSFGLSLAFAGQRVYKQTENSEQEAINIKTHEYVDVGNIYEDRMKNNYFKLFELLIKHLTEISDIVNIRDFISYIEVEKGEEALESIDLLSFLLSLSYIPEGYVEDPENENAQIIHMNENNIILDRKIEVFQIQELFTHFWFIGMKKEYNADLHVVTHPRNKVYIKEQNDRSIYNLSIKLIEKGSLRDG